MNPVMKWIAGAATAATLGGATYLAGVPQCCWQVSKRAAIATAQAATEESTCVLEIKGMTCASCGVAVKTALKKVEGFRSAKVSQKEGTAVVTYDPAKTSPQALADAVSKIGYAATPKDPAKADEGRARDE